MKLRVLELGYMYFEKFRLVKTPGETEMIKSPIVCLLIEHPQLGRVLYDTGVDDNWDITGSALMKKHYPVSQSETIVSALSKLGLTPEDIDILVLSHLHFDHAGGLKFFAGTRAARHVIVAEADAREAFYRVNLTLDGASGAYIKKLFSDLPGVAFEPMKGERRLADDLVLFTQKCHTPGVIGMELHLKDKNVIVTGDTLYTRESWEKQLPPGGTINNTNEEFFSNLELIRRRKEALDAELFFGHDMDQVIEWRDAGVIE